METLSGKTMKFNIGDLFIREQRTSSQTSRAYVSKTERNSFNYALYYLDFIFNDGTTEQRLYNTEGIQDLLSAGWKHYPVKE